MPKRSRTHRYDVISIGDAVFDTFLKVNTASLLCNIDKQSCWLCFNYAEKIPVDEMETSIGGNACNNAVGTSRLGLKAAFYSIIGDDDLGEKILNQVKREGVSTEYIHVQKKSPSNFSTVLNYKTERTILVHHEPRKYKLPKLGTSQWVYLTSMGKEFPAIHASLIKQIKQNGTKLAFNPGTHQLLAGKKVLEPMLRATNLLILNKEESQTLTGMRGKEPVKDLLRELHHLGPDIVVITDGPKGGYAYDGKDFYRMLPMPSKVVERTGAGDSFSTGLLSALCYDIPLQEALVWGAANAASVIEHVGPQAGLLNKKQILARICEAKGKCKKM